nr:MAG TPA: hypothetical protein [Caudoviricetes sp.]
MRGIVFIDTWNTLNVLFNAIYMIISYKILCCNERLLIVKIMPREISLSIISDNAFADTLFGVLT